MSKEWAIGMKQEEFEHEFVRKHPHSDYIPDLQAYLDFKPNEKPQWKPATEVEAGNDHLRKSEEFTSESKEKPVGGKRTTNMYKCRKCGKETKSYIGNFAHSSRCNGKKDSTTDSQPDAA